MFARGAHRIILAQLADLSEEMTPWLWTRWAAYQCTRAEQRNHSSCQIFDAAMQFTLQMFYVDRVRQAYEGGEDQIKLVAHVMGESWIFHQVCTFELGGLSEFLDTLATGRLAEEAGLGRSWVGARMGGYRLEGAEKGVLTVHDLRTDRSTDLLDLGAAVHAGADGWLMGRVVPSGTSPGLMFDTRPIAVDEQTAREVAGSATYAGWVPPLRRAVAEGRVDAALLETEDRELVTDVPSLELLRVGTPRAALASTMSQLAQGRDEIGRAAFRILREVAGGAFGPDTHAAYVAAAVLNPHGHAEARLRHAKGSPPEHWLRWAELVPDPARSRLQALAAVARAA